VTIPDKVKIGGVIFEVKRDVDRLAMGPDCDANILYNKTLIEIGSDQNEQIKQRNFIHEILHAIFWNLGETKHKNNENLVEKLAGALHQLIVDNLEMFR
jgi:hypothetical protein